jgi:RNA polymerase sigma-70 factor (ECF subfamily)
MNPSDPALEEFLRAGQRAWPAVVLPPEALAAHLARLAAEDGRSMADRAAHAADLYLACACAEGLAPAIAAFDRGYLSRVADFVARTDSSPEFASEVRQDLRNRLLVAAHGQRPRIARFSGRGPLGGWVRVAAVRVAVDSKRAAGRGGAGASIEGVPDVADGSDPDVQIVKSRYASQYQAALAEAWSHLSTRERNLLRLYYVDGSSIDRLAVHYGVHRATAARWVTAARASLLERVRGLLSARLKLTPAELDSVTNIVGGELHLSIGPLSIDVA